MNNDELLQNDETLTPQEEQAIAAFSLILSDIQLMAVIHIFAQTYAIRQGETEHTSMTIEINRPEGTSPLLVLPGGKI